MIVRLTQLHGQITFRPKVYKVLVCCSVSSQATEVLCPLRDRSSYGPVLESYGRTVTGLTRNSYGLVRSNERHKASLGSVALFMSVPCQATGVL